MHLAMPLAHRPGFGAENYGVGNTALRRLGLQVYAGSMSTVSPATAVPPGQWLEHMAQAVDEMLWVCDARTGQVLYANPAFERFWGAAAPMLKRGGEALLEFIHHDDRDRMRQSCAAPDDVPCTEEYRVKQPGAFGAPGRLARLREKAFRTRTASGQDWITHIARDIGAAARGDQPPHGRRTRPERCEPAPAVAHRHGQRCGRHHRRGEPDHRME